MKPALPEGVDVSLEGASRITATEQDRLSWIMNSQGLQYFRERKEARVTEPSALIPLANGGTVEVSARRGTYFQAGEDIFLEGSVRIVITREGKREWTLAGDTASYRRSEEAFYVGGFSGVLYPEEGDTVRIQAEQGRYDIKNRRMNLKNEVRCRFSGGMTLSTASLEYALDSGVARTESGVSIEGQGFTLTGRGLVADIKSREVVIPGEVNVVVRQGMGGENKAGEKKPGRGN